LYLVPRVVTPSSEPLKEAAEKRVMAMTSAMWMIMGIGAFFGTFLGRWWAEFRRARHDMARVWESRRNYRG
jgi:hypothetical protein